ncbi:hypothetical protein I4U23_022733 [Adineta vaga]|nr:hypothetical protein I4U23_022733 [Adineta vaga]
MAMTVPSAEQVSMVYIEIDKVKMGRVLLSHLSTAAELRMKLFERHKVSSNTHFLDSKDYPVSIVDEQSTNINELLCEMNVIKLQTDAYVSIPEKKSEIVSSQSELKFVSINNQDVSVPPKGPTIPGSMPTYSTKTVILATQLDSAMWKNIFDNCSLLCGIRMDAKEPLRAMHPIFKFKQSDNYTPSFQVDDSSSVRTYSRSIKMDSCFVSNDYFDGNISISCPFMGFGIDPVYKTAKSNTSEEREIHATCIFNHSRSSIELNLSYLEPTEEFIKDIDNVLQHTPTKNALNSVLSYYGHVYPQRIVLGGHLHYAEQHWVRGNIEEKERRMAVETRVKTALSKQNDLHRSSIAGKRSKRGSSEQNSSVTFEAVGGDTLLVRNPTAWEETLNNPMLWRVIDQRHCKSVLTLLSDKQQEAILRIDSSLNAEYHDKIGIQQSPSELSTD